MMIADLAYVWGDHFQQNHVHHFLILEENHFWQELTAEDFL